MGFDIAARTKVISLISEIVFSNTVDWNTTWIKQFIIFSGYLSFLGNNNLALPIELDCDLYALIFGYTQRVY